MRVDGGPFRRCPRNWHGDCPRHRPGPVPDVSSTTISCWKVLSWTLSGTFFGTVPGWGRSPYLPPYGHRRCAKFPLRNPPGMGDRLLSSAGTGKNCALSIRFPDPSPVLDKNRAPMGPEFLSSTGAGFCRKAPKVFPDSSPVLDKYQSAKASQI